MAKRSLTIWIKIPVLVVLLATIWVWQRITVVKMIRANDQLRAQVELKREAVDKLSAAVSQLRQRDRVTATACNFLRLEEARPVQVQAMTPATPDDGTTDNAGWHRFGNAMDKLVAMSNLGSE